MSRPSVIYIAALGIAAAIVGIGVLFTRSTKQMIDERVDQIEETRMTDEGVVRTDDGGFGMEVSAATMTKIAIADLLTRFAWPFSIGIFVIAVVVAKLLS